MTDSSTIGYPKVPHPIAYEDTSFWVDITSTTDNLNGGPADRLQPLARISQAAPAFTPLNNAGRLKFVRLDSFVAAQPAVPSSATPPSSRPDSRRIPAVSWLSSPTEFQTVNPEHPLRENPGRLALSEGGWAPVVSSKAARPVALPTHHFATAWFVGKEAYVPPRNALETTGVDLITRKDSDDYGRSRQHQPIPICTGPFVCTLEPGPSRHGGGYAGAAMRLCVTIEYEAGAELYESTNGVSSYYTNANNGVVFLAHPFSPWVVVEATPLTLVMRSAAMDRPGGAVDRIVYITLGIMSLVYHGDPEGIIRNVTVDTKRCNVRSGGDAVGNCTNQFGYGSVGLASERSFLRVWDSTITSGEPRDPLPGESMTSEPILAARTPAAVVNEFLGLDAPATASPPGFGSQLRAYAYSLSDHVVSTDSPPPSTTPIDYLTDLTDLLTLPAPASLTLPLTSYPTPFLWNPETDFKVAYATDPTLGASHVIHQEIVLPNAFVPAAFTTGLNSIQGATITPSGASKVTLRIPTDRLGTFPAGGGKVVEFSYFFATEADLADAWTRARVIDPLNPHLIFRMLVRPTSRLIINVDHRSQYPIPTTAPLGVNQARVARAALRITYGNIWLPSNTGIPTERLLPVILEFPGRTMNAYVPDFPEDGIPIEGSTSRDIVVAFPVGYYGSEYNAPNLPITTSAGGGGLAISAANRIAFVMGVKTFGYDFEETTLKHVRVNFHASDLIIPPSESEQGFARLLMWDPIFSPETLPVVASIARPRGFQIVELISKIGSMGATVAATTTLSYTRKIPIHTSGLGGNSRDDPFQISMYAASFNPLDDGSSSRTEIISDIDAIEISDALQQEFIQGSASLLWNGEPVGSQGADGEPTSLPNRMIHGDYLAWGRKAYRYARWIEMMARGNSKAYLTRVYKDGTGTNQTSVVRNRSETASVGLWKAIRQAITTGFMPTWPVAERYARSCHTAHPSPAPGTTILPLATTPFSSAGTTNTTTTPHLLQLGDRLIIFTAGPQTFPETLNPFTVAEMYPEVPGRMHVVVSNIVSATSFAVSNLIANHTGPISIVGGGHYLRIPSFAGTVWSQQPVTWTLSVFSSGYNHLLSPGTIVCITNGSSVALTSPLPFGYVPNSAEALYRVITTPSNTTFTVALLNDPNAVPFTPPPALDYFFYTVPTVPTGFDVVYRGQHDLPLSLDPFAVESIIELIRFVIPEHPNPAEVIVRFANYAVSASLPTVTITNLQRLASVSTDAASIDRFRALEESQAATLPLAHRISGCVMLKLVLAARMAIRRDRFLEDHVAGFLQLRYDRLHVEDTPATRSIWGGMTTRLSHELRRWALVLTDAGDAPDVSAVPYVSVGGPTPTRNGTNVSSSAKNWIRVIQLSNLDRAPSAQLRALAIPHQSNFSYYSDHLRSLGYLFYAASVALRYGGSVTDADFTGYKKPTTVREDMQTFLLSTTPEVYLPASAEATRAELQTPVPPMPLLQLLLEIVGPPSDYQLRVERGQTPSEAFRDAGGFTARGVIAPIPTSGSGRTQQTRSYPPHRQFDVYHGHSWSSGPTAPFHAMLQESPTECAVSYLGAYRLLNELTSPLFATPSAIREIHQTLLGYIYYRTSDKSSLQLVFPRTIVACLGSEMASMRAFQLPTTGLLTQHQISEMTLSKKAGSHSILRSRAFYTLFANGLLTATSSIGVGRLSRSLADQNAYRVKPGKWIRDLGLHVTPINDLSILLHPPDWSARIAGRTAEVPSILDSYTIAPTTYELTVERILHFMLSQAPLSRNNRDDAASIRTPSLEMQQWARVVATLLLVQPRATDVATSTYPRPMTPMSLETTPLALAPVVADPTAVAFPPPVTQSVALSATPPTLDEPYSADASPTFSDYYLSNSSWFDVLFWYRYATRPGRREWKVTTQPTVTIPLGLTAPRPGVTSPFA